MISDATKRLAFDAMRIKPINSGLRRLIKPVSGKLPYRLVVNMPVVGAIELELPDGQTITLVSDGCDSVASRIYWHGLDGYEPETLRLYLHMLKRSRTVFDVGAHNGLYALVAATEQADRTIYAFEPVPRTFAFLEENIAANDLHNISAFCQAVSDKNGEINLFIPNSIRLPAAASVLEELKDDTERVTVPTITIDSFVAENQVADVNLIKIDVEGAEDQVLRGAQETLDRHRPAIVCEVLYGYSDASLQAVLDSSNYVYFLVTSKALVRHERIVGDDTYFYKNYLFLPEERIPEVEEYTKII